jgi:phosphatidylserine/phosphatidylglycerophosphate/cardiolipin synthase-like enzyme
MRVKARQGDLSVHAIAGTYVVLFGMDVRKKGLDGLLGFAIERSDHTEGERFFLTNFLLFEGNDVGDTPDHSSRANPFQEFVWGDYTAKPDHDYTYAVSAVYGKPGGLDQRTTASVQVRTESEADSEHAVYFNRGAAGSQAYARRFNNKAPDDVPNREAWKWLSRGLFEGLVGFIGQANGPEWSLRAAVYEFQYEPALEAFKVAADAGADVQIVFDGVKSKTGPGTANRAALETAGIAKLAKPRTHTKISHNKFIVLLRRNKPVAVWTGSTNVTDGGIFGHSNVGHAVRDKDVAARYLAYWEELSGDPAAKSVKEWNATATTIPADRPRPGSITTVFSPRDSLQALEWYAHLMDGASESVFLTAAFGVSDALRAVFETDRDYLRYVLLDNEQGGVDTIRRDPDNRVVAGGFIGTGGWGQWTEEKLTNLNGHVDFVHTKYMLVDPLGDDPLVITGSANFSKASTTDNDENMLVIRGDQRVADIYLGEFMRLFNHFRLRGKVKATPKQPAPGPGAPKSVRGKLYLQEDDAWARRFFVSGSPEEKERKLFA